MNFEIANKMESSSYSYIHSNVHVKLGAKSYQHVDKRMRDIFIQMWSIFSLSSFVVRYSFHLRKYSHMNSERGNIESKQELKMRDKYRVRFFIISQT